MDGLGQSIFEEGYKEGFKEAYEEGLQEARKEFLQNMIQFESKNHTSADEIIQSIRNYLGVSQKQAEMYYRKFTCYTV